MTESPLIDRIAAKLGISCYAARKVRKAFVEALREEVEARWTIPDDNEMRPLVIAGLGSFKMRTRPAREFWQPGNENYDGVTKPPARRLVFTSKWEPIKP